MKLSRGMPRRTSSLLSVVFCSALALLAACSGGSQELEPLSLEQADLLANLQLKNFEAGPAELVLTRHTQLSDTEVIYTGSVDWENHSGIFEVSNDDTLTGLGWTRQLLIEQVPALNEAGSEALEVPIEWVFSGINDDSIQENASAAYPIVSSLGSDVPDNAVLVRQNEGAGFVSETDTELTLKYSASSTFTIDKDTQLMKTFEFSNAEGEPLWTAEIVSRDGVEVEIPNEVASKTEILALTQQP